MMVEVQSLLSSLESAEDEQLSTMTLDSQSESLTEVTTKKRRRVAVNVQGQVSMIYLERQLSKKRILPNQD